MRNILVAAAIFTTLTASMVAKADAFDDKAREAAEQQQQAADAKEHAAQYKFLTNTNWAVIHRVPRGATITQCFNTEAAWYRNESNGCYLANIEWNGYPVQICSEGYDQSLPPEIVECHYHINGTNQDCEVVANNSIKPRCY